MNYDDINGLYQHYLGRGASPDEAQGWLSGTYGPPDPASIAAQIAQSGEAQDYGGGGILPWSGAPAPNMPSPDWGPVPKQPYPGGQAPKGPYPGGMPESSRGSIGGGASGPIPWWSGGQAPKPPAPDGQAPKGPYPGGGPPESTSGSIGGAPVFRPPAVFGYGDFQAPVTADAALQAALSQRARAQAQAQARARALRATPGGAVGSYL